MRFFKRIAGFLGFVKDEARDQQQDDDDDDDNRNRSSSNFQETGLPRKGFSVPVKVAVDRHQLGPLLVPSVSGDGGVQGLRWYAKRLKVDDDGDVADEFLEEISPETLPLENQHKPPTRFQFKYNIRPAKIKNQVISNDGKFQQCVEHQGRLQWV